MFKSVEKPYTRENLLAAMTAAELAGYKPVKWVFANRRDLLQEIFGWGATGKDAIIPSHLLGIPACVYGGFSDYSLSLDCIERPDPDDK